MSRIAITLQWESFVLNYVTALKLFETFRIELLFPSIAFLRMAKNSTSTRNFSFISTMVSFLVKLQA